MNKSANTSFFVYLGTICLIFSSLVSCQNTRCGYFHISENQVTEMTSAEAKAYLYHHYGITEDEYVSYLNKAFEFNNPVGDVSLLLKAGADPNAIINKAN